MDIKDAFKAVGMKPEPASSQFFDQAGNLKLEFVQKATMNERAKDLARQGLTMGQLRRFFNYCRQVERRLRSKQAAWEQERSKVAKLSAYAADGVSKGKIPDSFRQFIDDNVNRVHSQRDFLDGFMEHFEALVGFAAFHLGQEKNR